MGEIPSTTVRSASTSRGGESDHGIERLWRIGDIVSATHVGRPSHCSLPPARDQASWTRGTTAQLTRETRYRLPVRGRRRPTIQEYGWTTAARQDLGWTIQSRRACCG